MKKFQIVKKTSFIVGLSMLFAGCTIPFAKSSKTALDIKSNTPATVYINDDSVGSTPFYRDDLKPDKYTIRLESENNAAHVWSTQVTLKPQLLTSIHKNFADTKDAESHFTLTLIPISKEDSSLTIITTPDSAVVRVDGQPVGFSPVEKDQIAPGDHQIILSSPGYKELPILIKIITGHELIVSAQLAKDKTALNSPRKVATSSASLDAGETSLPTQQIASSASSLKKKVKITQTGTGWLRVRDTPTTNTQNEVAKVDVGKSYPLLDETKKDWYQIQYKAGKSGWISSKYASLVK